MMDGGEGKGGLGVERGRQRGASITPLNLPVTARAWGGGSVRRVEGESFTLAVGQRFIFFLFFTLN